MLNLLKIDFLKTPDAEQNLLNILPQKSGTAQNFKDILNNEIKNVSDVRSEKGEIIEDISAKNSSYDYENRENRPEDIEHKKNDEARAVSERNVQNTGEKGKTAEKAGALRGEPGTEETSKSRDKKSLKEKESLIDDIFVLLNMLKGFKAKGPGTDQFSSVLNGLKDILSGKNGGQNNDTLKLKQLLAKLEALFKKLNINTGGLKNHYKPEELAEIAGFKKQVEKLIDSVKRHVEKGEKGGANIAKNDSVNENLKVIINEKSAPGEAARAGTEEKMSSRGDDSSMHSGSFRRGAGADGRNSLSRDVQRNSHLNDRQFQTILDRARIVVKDSRNGSFDVRLYPESLGRVSVKLSLEEGILAGRFFVENNEAKETLLSNISNFREQLEESGIAVGDFQVNVRDEKENFQGEQDDLPYLGRQDNLMVSDVYDMHASYYHDGEIDLII